MSTTRASWKLGLPPVKLHTVGTKSTNISQSKHQRTFIYVIILLLESRFRKSLRELGKKILYGLTNLLTLKFLYVAAKSSSQKPFVWALSSLTYLMKRSFLSWLYSASEFTMNLSIGRSPYQKVLSVTLMWMSMLGCPRCSVQYHH